MDPLTASLMSIGSGSAAGMRPYFTVFVLGFAALVMPEGAPGIVTTAVEQIPGSIANPWVVGICAILALADFLGGKVPWLDLSLEPITAWLRPVLGSLVGMQLGVESGAATAVFTTALGAGTSIPVSLGKTSATAATTAASGGFADWIRSLFEDASAFVLVVAAVLVPIFAAFLGLIAVAIGIVLFLLFRKAYRAMKMKVSDLRRRQAEARARRRAQIASGERVSTLQALKRLTAGATPAMATGGAPADAIRTGTSASASWARSAAGSAAQIGAAGFRRAPDAASSAVESARSRMQSPPPQEPAPQEPTPHYPAPDAGDMATPHPSAYSQPPPRPPMPPQAPPRSADSQHSATAPPPHEQPGPGSD